MARILCLDSDTHFSGHPGGQSKFTRDFVVPLADQHELVIATIGTFSERKVDGVLYQSLVARQEVSRSSQVAFVRAQRKLIAKEGEDFDVIVENFIPPIGPSALPRLTSTPVIGLANFSFWDEMSVKYHVPFRWITHRRLASYRFVATTHESVARRIRPFTPTADVRSFGQILEVGSGLWNELPGSTALFLGRPDVHQKGLDLLVRALNYLGHNSPSVTIAGFEATHPTWMKLTKKWPVPDCVTVKGYVRGEERERLLRSARVLLLSSRYEGPSYVPLEGAIRGIPTVAFNLDCFADRSAAMYLARPFDYIDFATMITRAFFDDTLYLKKRSATEVLARNVGRTHPEKDFREFVQKVSDAG